MKDKRLKSKMVNEIGDEDLDKVTGGVEMENLIVRKGDSIVLINQARENTRIPVEYSDTLEYYQPGNEK